MCENERKRSDFWCVVVKLVLLNFLKSLILMFKHEFDVDGVGFDRLSYFVASSWHRNITECALLQCPVDYGYIASQLARQLAFCILCKSTIYTEQYIVHIAVLVQYIVLLYVYDVYSIQLYRQQMHLCLATCGGCGSSSAHMQVAPSQFHFEKYSENTKIKKINLFICENFQQRNILTICQIRTNWYKFV